MKGREREHKAARRSRQGKKKEERVTLFSPHGGGGKKRKKEPVLARARLFCVPPNTGGRKKEKGTALAVCALDLGKEGSRRILSQSLRVRLRAKKGGKGTDDESSSRCRSWGLLRGKEEK